MFVSDGKVQNSESTLPRGTLDCFSQVNARLMTCFRAVSQFSPSEYSQVGASNLVNVCGVCSLAARTKGSQELVFRDGISGQTARFTSRDNSAPVLERNLVKSQHF